jgi:AcrR family transcriptional regulator
MQKNMIQDKVLTTKEKILQRAQALFAQNGYDGLRMDALAQEAKVNKATIYYYFKDKQSLYETIMCGVAEAFYAQVEHNMMGIKGDKARLSVFIDSGLDFVQTHRDIAKIMMVELSFEWKNVTPKTEAKFLPILQRLHEILDSGIQNGCFKMINPILLHSVLIGGFNYYLLIKNIYKRFEQKEHNETGHNETEEMEQKMTIPFSDGKEEIKAMILGYVVKDEK